VEQVLEKLSNFKQIFKMEEIIFVVEESPEGGYIAKALGVAIFTEAESIEEMRSQVVDAVKCHFDDEKKRIIRLHIVRDEVIAA
jgi:hypothetical protein